MKASLITFVITIFSLVTLNTTVNAGWPSFDPVATNQFNTVARSNKMKFHFIQIISSINATKAEGMKNTLKMRGYRAFIRIQPKQRNTHYQVQIGPFSSRRLAHNAKSSIIAHYPQFSFLNKSFIKLSF